MNALMSEYDSLGELPRPTTPVSVFDRSSEEMQSASVVSNGYLWQESLLRMLYEEASIIQSSAAIAQEDVERVALIWKAEGSRRLFEKWREEDEEDGEEEQQEILEYSRLDLGEGGFC